MTDNPRLPTSKNKTVQRFSAEGFVTKEAIGHFVLAADYDSLTTRLTQAEAEVEQLTKMERCRAAEVNTLSGEIKRLAGMEPERLKYENERLRVALKRYGVHDWEPETCVYYDDKARCSCGLGALSADSPAAPQAPIFRVVLSGGQIVGATPLAPGLPDGEHELYCEAEATAPYLRSAPETKVDLAGSSAAVGATAEQSTPTREPDAPKRKEEKGAYHNANAMIRTAAKGLRDLIIRIEAKGEASHWLDALPALREAHEILQLRGFTEETSARLATHGDIFPYEPWPRWTSKRTENGGTEGT